MTSPIVLGPAAHHGVPSMRPRKQARPRTMASLFNLRAGNHHPDPLLQSALRSASFRFHESRRPDPLFVDPYAGIFLAPELVESQSLSSEYTSYRLATKFIDDKVLEMISNTNELRQVVLLTDGMDTRPFRLIWPRLTVVYDVSHGSIFQLASQRLEGVEAKISRSCMLLHVPLESSSIQAALCEKGFNGNRPSIWALQGLPLMTLSDFSDLLFLVSSLAMKGSIFLGELPGWLMGSEFGSMAAAQTCMEKLFMSHSFRVSIVDYSEVARKVHLDPPIEGSSNILFIAEHLRLSDAQMERWRSELERLEEEGDEEGFEEL